MRLDFTAVSLWPMKVLLLKHGFHMKWLMRFGHESRMWQQYQDAGLPVEDEA
jgi:hypothetical protein